MDSNEQRQAQSGKRKTIILISIICGILAIAGASAMFLFGGGDGIAGSTAGNGQVQMVDIKTSYVTMQFPEAYAESLSHREVTEGNVTSEIFSLSYNETELELFRICFGDGTIGELEGYLHTGEGEIPITLVIADYANIEFSEDDEEVRSLYFSMLESVSTVLDSIHSDERFSEYNSAFTGNKEEVRLTYFSVSLPADVGCEESTDGDIYKAEFYVTIDDRRIMLYNIYLGDSGVGSLLGTYTVDGEAKPVFIETGNLDSLESLNEEDRSAVYLLMETINDVVGAITSSENFSDEIPSGS